MLFVLILIFCVFVCGFCCLGSLSFGFVLFLAVVGVVLFWERRSERGFCSPIMKFLCVFLVLMACDSLHLHYMTAL